LLAQVRYEFHWVDIYHLIYHFNGMTTTIDKAGRVVIPAALRRKAGLTPGTPLIANYENGVIQIVRDAPTPMIKKRGNRRIATPSKRGDAIDLAALIEEERDRWPL
jgi:AbrB family looped-hinge helix DNA binding protein